MKNPVLIALLVSLLLCVQTATTQTANPRTLPEDTTPAGGDIIPVWKASPIQTRKLTLDTLTNFVLSSGEVCAITNLDIKCDFGTLGTADDTIVFQSAIDYVSATSSKGVVTVPPGNFFVCNLGMKSLVNFVGNGLSSKFTAPTSCSGSVIKLDSVNVERVHISGLWIEGNKANASVSCLDLNNDGGVFTGADSNLKLSDIFCTNPALDGFRLKSRGMQLHDMEARNPSLDCFSFLSGSTVSSTDSVISNLHANACGRDGLHFEAGNNTISSVKVGEAARYGVYISAYVSAISISSIDVDNTGYPAFLSGTPVRVEGIDNSISVLTITRGVGDAIVIPSGGLRNLISGNIAPVVGGGTITYGVLVSAGAADNDIRLSARLSGTPAMTGAVNPASDVANNRVEVNNVIYGISRSANTVLAGPTSGTAAPAFRLLVAGDIPAHSSTHKNGGSDEVATATAAANAIPKAGTGGTLATGWLPAATTSAQGAVVLSGDAEATAGEAVQGNDSRLTGLSTGTYTPTLTAVTNVSASTAFLAFWSRQGNQVTVTIPRVDVDPTAGNVQTALGISLPVASDLTLAIDVGGVGSCDFGLSQGNASGRVLGDATNNRAELTYPADTGHANRSWTLTFTYLVK